MEFYLVLVLILGLLGGIFLLYYYLHDFLWGFPLPAGMTSNSANRIKKPLNKEDYVEAYLNNTNFSANEEGEDDLLKKEDKGEQEEQKQETSSDALLQDKGGDIDMHKMCPAAGIELLKIPVVIGENTIQKMEIKDNVLDFTAQKIRHIDAHITDITYEVITNKVIVQGTIVKQLFYVGLDNIVHHQHEEVHFSFFADVPGASLGMDAQIYPCVEFIKPELIQGGNVVHQKMIIEVFVKVTEERQVFVETSNEGPLLKVDRVIGENASQTLIEGSVTLPVPAIKVTEIDARILNIVSEVIDDKVIVQGIIEKQIFYIGEDDIEHHFHEELPFSHFIDVPGAEPGMNVQIVPIIEYIKPILSPNGLLLRQEIVIELFAKVSETVQIQLALCGNLLVKASQVIGEDTKQVLVENEVILNQIAIKIKEILAEVRDVCTVVLPNKIIIQGIVHKQIFYIGEDNVEYHQAEDVPFSTFVDIPGAQPGMEADVLAVIEYLRPEFNRIGDSLHQKIVLEFFVKVTETVQVLVKTVEGCPYHPYTPYEPYEDGICF